MTSQSQMDSSPSQLLSVPDCVHLITSSRRSSYASTSSSRQSRLGGLRRRRMTQWKLSALRDPQLRPIEKLKRFLRSVRIIVEVCLALKRYVKGSKEAPTLVEMQMKLQEDFDKRLPFNPHYYNASYVANKGSSKLKKLLAISPAARTKRHVKTIHTLVENKSAFSKHPIHIRMRMCQVMIYQCYGAKRVVIKQGHPPSAFYIILSGTCLINAKEVDSHGYETSQTVNELHDGEVFGEVALLNNSARTASVVCKDEVELLVIYKEDFDAIIRGPIYRQREEVVDYCKKIPVLSDWPINLLSSASVVNFYFQYFRKGNVVIRNSASSNFLVFIKSGECRIVCTLDGDHENKSLKATKLRHTRDSFRPDFSLPSCATNERSSRAKEHYACKPPTEQGNSLKLPAIRDVGVSGATERSSRRRAVFALSPKHNFHHLLQPRMQSVSENLRIIENRSEFSLGQNLGSQRLKVIRRSIRHSVIEDTPYAIAKKDPSLVTIERKQKAATAFEEETDSTPATNPWIKPPMKPKFAQIALLRPGCTFGLEEMMNRTKLRLSLISDGAECIFISRKLFLKHSGPKTLQCVNSMIGKYPTEDFIRHQMSKYVAWKEYREGVVKGLLEQKDKRIDLPGFLKAK